MTTALRRALRFVLTGFLTLWLMGLFLIAVVMGQPDPEEGPSPTLQPLPEPLAAPVHFSGSLSLEELLAVFPAPVMLPEDGGLTLVGAECRDVPFEEGVARTLTLSFQAETGEALTLAGVYPARALSLLAEGYAFASDPTQFAAGMTWVVMQNGTEVRLHTQSGEALYVLTAPASASAALNGWLASMQLVSAGE